VAGSCVALAASAVAGLMAGSWLPRHRQWIVRALAAAACLAGLTATGLAATHTATADFGTSYAIDNYLRWLAPAFLRRPASTQPDPLLAAGAWAAVGAYAAGTISLVLGIAAGAFLPLLTGTLLR
jgi:hypothetical protein